MYSSHHIKDVFYESLIIAVLEEVCLVLEGVTTVVYSICLPLTLYLELRDNLAIDVQNLCFSKNSKVCKTTNERLCKL